MADLTNVRRKNREVTDESWIKRKLKESPYAAFGLEGNGQPYINSNLFIYDEAEHCIYFHTAGQGFTRELIKGNNRICFSIFEMGRLLPGKKAVDFSTEYSSIVIFGRAAIVEDQSLAANIMKRYFEKYTPHLAQGRDMETFTDADVQRTTVYKISIVEWSAKQNKAADDHEGAFSYQPTIN